MLDDALHRRRLPNWRRDETHSVAIDRTRLVGFVGDGGPAEVFLAGAKDGSGLAAVLEDAGVVISIALQHGIAAVALAKSVARMPETIDEPAVKAASPIGAVLDLLAVLGSTTVRTSTAGGQAVLRRP